ncbi:hypothetical protein [Oryzihumus leptocrescens]|uniref:Uncharacterized protein n=1 Tax=Oryzihumus leptocrescens TaxID=297536 RepID=A0A542ZMS8_9MICO|nr:hypothetical protein [Oryzihumus leptocrescens]TQL61668.1 hypothetical protein FB474_3083 [Oryzihumus leptocrescens]
MVGRAPAAHAAPTTSQLTQGYLDLRSGDYLRVQLDPASVARGNFVVAIPHVGLVWPTGRASVTVESPQSTQLRYDGGGTRDADAILDTEFGVGYRQQGAGQAVHLRVVGHVDPAHGTASVRVWIDDALTNIVTEPASDSQSASDAASAYLSELKARDWAALYAMADSDLRSGLSEAKFAEGMAQAPEAQGLAGASADAPTVSTNGAGVTWANVPIHLTYANKPSKDGTLVLILQASGWKVFTVK